MFNNAFIGAFLDRGKSDWDVVRLQLLYFVLENIDNYAALCFGTISQELVEANPLFAFMVGLIFGQLYGSDLPVVCKNVFLLWVIMCRLLFDLAADCGSASIILAILMIAVVIIGLILITLFALIILVS